ncbi:hypothetical protein L3Q82_016000 [Scortum barcoo]|uniref:Uncharacterized protein n=1 Tax=Scortum barcoo TaxID=214431 RepID=A0ACB8VQ43_9TELE|nr:hypothetical protein L3Q82_016000 [Scortum barcoo]
MSWTLRVKRGAKESWVNLINHLITTWCFSDQNIGSGWGHSSPTVDQGLWCHCRSKDCQAIVLVPVVAEGLNPVVDTGSEEGEADRQAEVGPKTMLACGTLAHGVDMGPGKHGRPALPGKPSKPWRPGPVLEAKTRVWEEFGEAMEEDYHRSASKRFWQTVRRLRRGKQYSANTVYSAGGELLTSTRLVDIVVGRWKKYFEDLLNPTEDLPSNEEAEAEAGGGL